MKNHKVFVLVSLLFVVAFISGSSCRQQTTTQTIKIGAIIPLTGRFAALGEPIKGAMDLAVSQINSQGGAGGKQIEIVYADSQGDARTGVSSAQRLIDSDGVKIITTFLTGVSEAVKPVTEGRQVLLLAQTVSPSITKDAKNTIRMHYSFVEEGDLLAKHLVAVGQKPIGFIRSKDPSTSYEVEQIIIPYLKSNGIDQITDETFDIGNKDFKPHAAKMKSAGVKQICVLGYGTDMPNALRELKVVGLLDSAKVSGNLGFVELPTDTPPELLPGIVFSAPPILVASQKNDQVKAFEEAFRSATKKDTVGYAAYYAYDLIYLLKKALETSPSDKVEDIRATLSKSSFPLLTGTYQFSPTGDAHPATTLATFNGNEIALFGTDNKANEPGK
jgi:branched-chain amino acid transport system substrate-binding protein